MVRVHAMVLEGDFGARGEGGGGVWAWQPCT